MNMYKLMSRLAEIDSGSKLRTLSESAVNEDAGIPGMEPPAISPVPHTPANISVSASSGPELSAMLKDLMSLAGVHQVGQEHMPVVGQPGGDVDAAVSAEPELHVDSPDSMRKMIDTMNSAAGPEEEDGEGDGVEIEIGGDDQDSDDEQSPDDEDEEKADESYDNTPSDPNDIPQADANDYTFQPNSGDHGNRQVGLPHGMPVEESLTVITAQLFSEYKGFLSK